VHLANEGGGRDNISVVVVDITDDNGRSRALEARADDHRLVDVRRMEDRPIGGEPSDSTMIDTGFNGDGAATDGDITAVRPLPGMAGGDQPAVRVNRSAVKPTPVPAAPTRTTDGRVVVDRAALPPAAVASSEVAPVAVAPAAVRQPRTRFTWRVALFVIAFVGIFVGAIYAVNWVADNSYFVGTDGDKVAIYQGRPGGLLWREPRAIKYAGFPIDQVLVQFQADVRAGRDQPTLAEADKYVARVKAPPTTATTSTTTTTPGGVPGLDTTTTAPPPLGP
jgi:hypothetical protein